MGRKSNSIKERPATAPSWTALMSDSSSREKDELNLIWAGFQDGTFQGILVINWCAKCGRWRTHYVPYAKKVNPEDVFVCVPCGSKLPLVVEDKLVVLRSDKAAPKPKQEATPMTADMLKEDPKTILFWGPSGEFGFLDNFYDEPFTLDGKLWLTSEHYYQAMKTLDPKERETVQFAEHPGAAKHRGQKVTMRADWQEVRYGVMVDALRAKFGQHPVLKAKLLATGDAIIHEDSPYDFIWGWRTGKDGKPGLDLLGKALMQVRKEFLQANDKAKGGA